jgi:SAM-dependent methyltransferase
MTSVYDSERLAAGYAFDRPPIHEHILRSARLERRALAGNALDAGCGAGLSTAALAPLERQVVGLEPIHAMLAHRRTVAPHARFVIGEAELLPLAAGSFDLVAAAGSLNYVDLPLALAEITCATCCARSTWTVRSRTGPAARRRPATGAGRGCRRSSRTAI